ncbi:SgcJ/EcaC family oxidoreductase [Streptomyces sp. NPDC048639]|uniref:SgcJ/EcaC family oxidoreductase n=1 Tax=Streptomyces sp. NPDC048639 TaxID=3365581 RepID=UPI0037220CF0
MTTTTTMTADDEKRIHALWDAMAGAWAAGDAPSFAANFSQTCDFTTVRGEKPPGRDGIAAGHDRLFRTAYRDTTLRARVTGIRPLRPGLAAVNAESTIVGADGTPLASTHALAIVERTAATDAWHITAFHNMVPVAPAGDR